MIATDILLALLINVATGELCKAFAFHIAKCLSLGRGQTWGFMLFPSNCLFLFKHHCEAMLNNVIFRHQFNLLASFV